MTGTLMRVKGVKRWRHPKTAIWYAYHRASGTRIEAEFGTAEFVAELADIERRTKDKATRSRPGTLGLLFAHYRKSQSFTALRPRVRAGYEDAMCYIDGLAETPIDAITPAWAAKLRDKVLAARSWHFANDVRKVLSVAFSVGCEAGLCNANPIRDCKRAKRPKDIPEGNRAWTYDERVAVMEAAPIHLKLPIALGMYMALRLGDVLTLTKTARRGTALYLRTQKTCEYAELPIPAPLLPIIEAGTQHDAITFCANSRGRPWTDDGFRTSFRRLIATLEAEDVVRPGLTFHGLRHTAAEVMVDMGISKNDRAAYLTHSEQMAEHYSRNAERRHIRAAIAANFDPMKQREK